MTKKLAKKLKEKEIELAPVDKETAQRIRKISKHLDGANSLSIVHAAIQLFEKAIGKTVTMTEDGSQFSMTIEKYSKYQVITEDE